MESRKIQMTGGSSFIVTLPKDWVEGSGLRKNDTVYLETAADRSLIIRSNTADTQEPRCVKTIEIDAGTQPAMIFRLLLGAYIAGHTEIRTVCPKPMTQAIHDVIKGFCQTAVGMEILEESESSVTVKNLMDPHEVRPSTAVDRMKVLAKNLLSDTVASMVAGSPLDSPEVRDRDIDRVDWLMSRQASMMMRRPALYGELGITPADMMEHLEVSRIIECLGDNAVAINDCMAYMKDPIAIQSIGAAIEDLHLPELFSDCMDTFVSKDVQKANGCIMSCGDRIKRILEVLELSTIMDSGMATATAMVSGNMKRIITNCKDIAELTIDSAMRTV